MVQAKAVRGLGLDGVLLGVKLEVWEQVETGQRRVPGMSNV